MWNYKFYPNSGRRKNLASFTRKCWSKDELWMKRPKKRKSCSNNLQNIPQFLLHVRCFSETGCTVIDCCFGIKKGKLYDFKTWPPWGRTLTHSIITIPWGTMVHKRIPSTAAVGGDAIKSQKATVFSGCPSSHNILLLYKFVKHLCFVLSQVTREKTAWSGKTARSWWSALEQEISGRDGWKRLAYFTRRLYYFHKRQDMLGHTVIMDIMFTLSLPNSK